MGADGLIARIMGEDEDSELALEPESPALRDIAQDSGGALVVGDQGTILQLVPGMANSECQATFGS